MTPARRRWAAGTLAALTGVFAARPAAQQPTFRSAVDLVAVDVQVVDRNGTPILGLGPADFEVTIAGRRQDVISVELLKYAPAGPASQRRLGTGPQARNEWPAPGSSGPGRTFIIAIDAGSFQPAESVGVVHAARSFIERLAAIDQVGVFTIPRGVALQPTADRAAVRSALDRAVGTKSLTVSRYHLTPSEVVDIAETDGQTMQPAQALENDVIRDVHTRECRGRGDSACLQGIMMEAAAMSRQMDEQAALSMAGLNGLMQLLAESPGRKTVVLISGGMPVSDRPGGWHADVIEGGSLGHDAARASATIYAIHLDRGYRDAFAAEQRMPSPLALRSVDRELEQRLLGSLASRSGGALIALSTGSGELGFDRVLLETSAYYLLAVAPVAVNLDGKTHQLRVRVRSARGATVRSRQFVLLRAGS